MHQQLAQMRGCVAGSEDLTDSCYHVTNVPCYFHVLPPCCNGSLSAVLGFQALFLLVERPVRPLIAVTLASVEVAAVVLFLIPRTLVLGSILLIVVLASAAVVHLQLRQPPPWSYLVYAAAIWVVVRDARRTRPIGGGR